MSKSSDRGTARPKISKVTRNPKGEPTQEPCGCREQVYDDETVDAFPCVPHALQKAATSLQEAGGALGYVGHSLQQAEARQREMKELNDKVDAGIEKGDIT